LEFSPCPKVIGPGKGLNRLDLKSIARDWIMYDKDTKLKNTMIRRGKSWTKSLDPLCYNQERGFPKAPCFDPAPFNETG